MKLQLFSEWKLATLVYGAEESPRIEMHMTPVYFLLLLIGFS